MRSRDTSNPMRRPGTEYSTHASSAEAAVTAAWHVHFRPSFSLSVCQAGKERWRRGREGSDMAWSDVAAEQRAVTALLSRHTKLLGRLVLYVKGAGDVVRRAFA